MSVSIRSSLGTGIRRVLGTPRLVLLAWIVNISLGLLVALPMFAILDSYIGGTFYEETLMQRMDDNWMRTFKEDHPGNPIVGMFDYSMMGASTFLSHLDGVLGGGVVTPVAGVLYDVLFRWTIPVSSVSVLMMLALVGVVVNALLGAGFIATYRGNYPPTIGEFLTSGAPYFGPFLRLAGVVFLLQAIIVYPLIGGISSWIASATQNEASEMVPFVYYMIRNAFAFLALFLVSLAGDYARVRVVLEQRSNAVGSFFEGLRFVLSNLRVTSGVGLFVVVSSLLAMFAYGILEYLLPKDTGGLILVLFILHQGYIIVRQGLRALAYASEVDVFQSSGIRS